MHARSDFGGDAADDGEQQRILRRLVGEVRECDLQLGRADLERLEEKRTQRMHAANSFE